MQDNNRHVDWESSHSVLFLQWKSETKPHLSKLATCKSWMRGDIDMLLPLPLVCFEAVAGGTVVEGGTEVPLPRPLLLGPRGWAIACIPDGLIFETNPGFP